MTNYFLFEECQKCYQPRLVPHFDPEKVFLAKGADRSSYCDNLVEAIGKVYPQAQIIQKYDLPHNKIELSSENFVERHFSGKRTLVLGIHKSAVRYSDEEKNTCPNYWHFSCYSFCPYDCQYCYLAGTPGVKYSPYVKIFLNLDEILDRISRIASKVDKPISFYSGKLQDGLALDPLTGCSRIVVPFFANQKNARQIILTKSAEVSNLLDIEHGGHTHLSWSLNPEAVCSQFERNTPTVQQRIEAMRQCDKAGYPLRAVIMPVIPITGWQKIYHDFLISLLDKVRLERVTFGQICSFTSAKYLMEQKLGGNNSISSRLNGKQSKDGRYRFPIDMRINVYRFLIDVIKSRRPDLEIGLCLEENEVFESLGMTDMIGRCNCVL